MSSIRVDLDGAQDGVALQPFDAAFNPDAGLFVRLQWHCSERRAAGGLGCRLDIDLPGAQLLHHEMDAADAACPDGRALLRHRRQNCAFGGNVSMASTGTTRQVAYWQAAVSTAWSQLDPQEYPFARGVAGRIRDHDDRMDFLARIDLILSGIKSSRGG
jgi:hypothetical protein